MGFTLCCGKRNDGHFIGSTDIASGEKFHYRWNSSSQELMSPPVSVVASALEETAPEGKTV